MQQYQKIQTLQKRAGIEPNVHEHKKQRFSDLSFPKVPSQKIHAHPHPSGVWPELHPSLPATWPLASPYDTKENRLKISSQNLVFRNVSVEKHQ